MKVITFVKYETAKNNNIWQLGIFLNGFNSGKQIIIGLKTVN